MGVHGEYGGGSMIRAHIGTSKSNNNNPFLSKGAMSRLLISIARAPYQHNRFSPSPTTQQEATLKSASPAPRLKISDSPSCHTTSHRSNTATKLSTIRSAKIIYLGCLGVPRCVNYKNPILIPSVVRTFGDCRLMAIAIIDASIRAAVCVWPSLSAAVGKRGAVRDECGAGDCGVE